MPMMVSPQIKNKPCFFLTYGGENIFFKHNNSMFGIMKKIPSYLKIVALSMKKQTSTLAVPMLIVTCPIFSSHA
jgi:hypothetical protein